DIAYQQENYRAKIVLEMKNEKSFHLGGGEFLDHSKRHFQSEKMEENMGNNRKNMTEAFSGIDNRRQKYILISYGVKKGKKRAKKGQKMTKKFSCVRAIR